LLEVFNYYVDAYCIITLMRKLVLLFCALCVGSAVVAQIDYPIFRDSATLRAEDSSKLSLQIDNFNYARNYEYFGDIPLSYTLLGYQFIPQLKYVLNEHFSLKGGIFLRREFGLDGFTDIDPVLTARYQNRGFSFLMGTLEGTLTHRFIEPIYDVEGIITDRMEQGLQVLVNKKRFWLDWYIDWQKAIELNSPYREEFSTGLSSRIKLVDKEKLTVELPLQAMVNHKGGQIDTSNLPVESLLNTAVGASFTFPMRSSFLKAIKTDHYFAYYRDLSGQKLQLFDSGTGWYSSLIFKTKWNIDLDARYWKGNGFYGPRGGALYSSVSEKVAGYSEEDRELVFLSVIYDKQLFPNVFIDLRLEPYYDVRNRFVEYSYSIFLRFNKDFLLKRLR
jgi:hypothetical protein